ncbi:NADH-quinone oxidoreductase subunit A [Pedobacter sp. SYSU D00535]|uniref:NADH-quinone oxidoreductase subunit A n=1 Tax=Pedobacter sp. SYSU D00535 TaxID=2810308 RepID=UPI001A964AD5|nr:NADH-quinone oxidoreductase subunit A [Pedobacter sp. SYSU D00535]
MEQVSQLTEFGKVFIYLIIGIILVSVTLFISKLLAVNKPTPLKLSSYECGEEPTGNSWVQFNTRFYVIALVFLLFDVEMVFIFPWTTVFGQKSLLAATPSWGWLTLTEMFIFVGILLLGLVYVWVRGDLDWIKPEQKLPTVDTAIPRSLYERINNEVYAVRPSQATAADETISAASATSTTAPKPAFKPTFRKQQNES